MKYVAFIGSRDLSQFSQDQLDLYVDAVRAAVQHGYAIVTGACKGADQLAANAALRSGGKVLLVLPSEQYEARWIQMCREDFPGQIAIEVYDPALHKNWTLSVLRYHPAPQRLDEKATQMHARNYGIVGRAIAVVALPNYQKDGGGTAQGLRIANVLNIRLYDLRDQARCRWLMQGLTGQKVTKQPEIAITRREAIEIIAAFCPPVPDEVPFCVDCDAPLPVELIASQKGKCCDCFGVNG